MLPVVETKTAEIIRLLQKIKSKTVTVGVVGAGYVGLPLALSFAEAGLTALAFDIDPEKVCSLEAGESYLRHVSGERIKKARKIDKLIPSGNFSRVAELDALILCLPTPLNRNREPDLSFVLQTMELLLPYLQRGQMLALESTTYPGTTEEKIAPLLEGRGLIIGEDVFLVYSPEREDPGNIAFNTVEIPKVIGGFTPACLEVGLTLYEAVFKCVVPVSSTKTAEFTKLLENIYRAVNIGLVNELKMVADRMGVDIWEVIEAASTKPFGFTPFYPGPGWGGHCIPIDPFYLTWKAREYGVNTRFIELAGEVNISMPDWVMGKLANALNNQGKAVKGSRIMVLGIAYKKNVDDMRESPAVKLMELLKKKGAALSYSDPLVPRFPKMREHFFDLQSEDLASHTLKAKDCILIATDHDCFDYEMILTHSRLIVDTRGRYRGNHPNVVKC